MTENFQGPVISLLSAVVVVVAGSLFNAFLNRRRDDRLREEEAKAVAAAIYGEILSIRVNVADAARIIASAYFSQGFGTSGWRFDNDLAERVHFHEAKLFQTLAAKVGLLPPPLVLQIIEFHSNYQEIQIWFPRLIEKKERKFSYSVDALLDPAEKVVLGIKPALREFEKWLGIAEAAADPELGKTLAAIDHEKAAFQQ